VYSCGSSLKFSPEDHGRPDPRTWRRASKAAAALFGSWKNCPIRQNPNLLQKRLNFLFSLYFLFFFFFDCFFRFCFGLLSNFLVFESHLTKSKKGNKKNSNFLRFFRFLSNYFRTEKAFSIYFRIIFDSQKQFSTFFRIKKDFLKKIEPEAPFDFLFAITGATLARVVATSFKSHVLGTFRDDGKLTSYSFNKNRR
jgi:hypothetical protein